MRNSRSAKWICGPLTYSLFSHFSSLGAEAPSFEGRTLGIASVPFDVLHGTPYKRVNPFFN